MYDEEIPLNAEGPRTLPIYPPAAATPGVKEVVVLYLFSGGLLVFCGTFLQEYHLLFGLLVTELLFLLMPPLLYAWRRQYDFTRTFQLAPIPFETVWLTPIIAAAAFVLIGILAVGQEMVFPRSANYQELWERAFTQFQQIPWPLTLLIVAILPGICEEVFFRGFLLRGLRQKYSDGGAIVLVGVLFGLFHLDPYRFLAVTLLGMLFGYLVVKTGSIFTGMLAHATNNILALLLSSAAQQFPQRAPAASAEIPLLPLILGLALVTGLALTIFLAGLRAISRASAK
jgi:membrane protease YdiL (CAAX protease family)